MKKPPAEAEIHWTASPWQALVYEDVVRAPETYGVVILGDSRQESILVTHGSIRQEAWRLFSDPRSKANDAAFFRFIETMVDRRAEHLARMALRELKRTTATRVHWMDFAETAISVPRSRTTAGHPGR